MALGDRNTQRIQSNIKNMIDQGAPEEHIDSYIADEGFSSAEEFVSFSQQAQPIEQEALPTIARQEGRGTPAEALTQAFAPQQATQDGSLLDKAKTMASQLVQTAPVMPGGQSIQQMKQLATLGMQAPRVAESVVAEPALALQRGEPSQVPEAIKMAMSGRSVAEYGDVYKQAGLPEPVAAAMGTITDVAFGSMLGKLAGIPKKIVVKPGEALNVKKHIQEPLFRVIKGTKKGAKQYGQIKKVADKATEAIEVLADNKDHLKFVDEFGNVERRLPTSRIELAEAVSQTKKHIWQAVDFLENQAGKGGIEVKTNDIVDELNKVAKDRNIGLKDPTGNVRSFAINLADNYKQRGNLTVSDVEDIIQASNRELDAYYKNPNFENANIAGIKSLVANNLRKKLDDAVSGVTGHHLSGLKRKYGALRTIEEDVVKAANRQMNQGQVGLIDFADIYSYGDLAKGILTQNPAQMAKGSVQLGIKKYMKFLNDPDKTIQRMFKTIDTIKNRKLAEIPGQLGVAGMVTLGKDKK